MLRYEFSRITDFDDSKLEITLSLLSENQKSYINRLVPHKMKQSICVRALLKTLLSEYKIPLSSLEFDKNGKPILVDSNLYISFTHSNEYVGCAISDCPVGIDIEQIKPIKPSVIKRVCSTEEQKYLTENNLFDFFILWTLKEAYIKAENKKIPKMSDISFVNNGQITNRYLTGEIDNYKWALIAIEQFWQTR